MWTHTLFVYTSRTHRSIAIAQQLFKILMAFEYQQRNVTFNSPIPIIIILYWIIFYPKSILMLKCSFGSYIITCDVYVLNNTRRRTICLTNKVRFTDVIHHKIVDLIKLVVYNQVVGILCGLFHSPSLSSPHQTYQSTLLPGPPTPGL